MSDNDKNFQLIPPGELVRFVKELLDEARKEARREMSDNILSFNETRLIEGNTINCDYLFKYDPIIDEDFHASILIKINDREFSVSRSFRPEERINRENIGKFISDKFFPFVVNFITEQFLEEIKKTLLDGFIKTLRK